MASVWERVQLLEGKIICTLARDKPFKITSVTADQAQLVPQGGNGAVRVIQRDRIEATASMGLQKSELRAWVQQEYSSSRNTSYIAAIVYEVTK